MSTDTLTAKFTLTTNFQTIQSLRHTLTDELHQAKLSSLLSDTLSAYLTSLLQTEFDLQTSLRVSRPQTHRTGPRLPIPLCQAGLLTWYDADADRTNLVGRIGSKAFIDALHSPGFKSFRYFANPSTTITIYRRSNGKWYASKRVNGQLKRRYIGLPENMTVSKLNQITLDLLGGIAPE